MAVWIACVVFTFVNVENKIPVAIEKHVMIIKRTNVGIFDVNTRDIIKPNDSKNKHPVAIGVSVYLKFVITKYVITNWTDKFKKMDEKNTFFFEIIDNKFDSSINKSYILPLYFFKQCYV